MKGSRSMILAFVEPDTILPDHVLARVAEADPDDVEALGTIDGVGPILAGGFGADMLDALRGSHERSET